MSKKKIRKPFTLKQLENFNIENALLEAVWIMRWTSPKKKAMASVLTIPEAEKMVKDIQKELRKAGYEIVKKKSIK